MQNKLGIINKTIREVVGAMIGLMVTILFSIVILAVIIVAVFSPPQQATPLLNTALALVASALSAVLGFFLGRRTQDK